MKAGGQFIHPRLEICDSIPDFRKSREAGFPCPVDGSHRPCHNSGQRGEGRKVPSESKVVGHFSIEGDVRRHVDFDVLVLDGWWEANGRCIHPF